MSTARSDIDFRIKAHDEATSTFRKIAEHGEMMNKTFERMKHTFEAAFVGVSIAGIVEGFSKINEQIEQMGNAAQKVGMPVEQLSRLEYAARLASVPFDALQAALVKFDIGLTKAATSGKGDVAAVLKGLGISARDSAGQLKTQNEILAQAADKISKYGDSYAKTTLLAGLFGKKVGTEMAPLMNAGGAAIRDAGKELDAFGGTVTERGVKTSEEFIKSIKRITQGVYSIAQMIVEYANPAVTSITEKFVDFLKDGNNARDAAYEIAQAIKNVAEYAVQGYGALEKMGLTAMYLSERISNGFDAEAYAGFKQELEGINKQIQSGIDLIEKYNTEAQKSWSSEKGDREGSKTGKGPQAPLIALGGDAVTRHTKALDKLAQEAKRVFDATRTPLEKYNGELTELNTLLNKGKITQDTYNRAVDQSFTEYVHSAGAMNKFAAETEKTNAYLDTLKKTSEDWINQFVDGTLNIGDSLRGLLKSFEKIALNNAFQQIFNGAGENPIHGGGGGGLGGIFKSLFGFAEGGTILPGGSGGTDSQIVAFRKTPDEQVDITTPAQRRGSSSGGGVTHIHIDARGADAGQIAALRQELRSVTSQLGKTVKGIVSNEKRSNPRAFS